MVLVVTRVCRSCRVTTAFNDEQLYPGTWYRRVHILCRTVGRQSTCRVDSTVELSSTAVCVRSLRCCCCCCCMVIFASER